MKQFKSKNCPRGSGSMEVLQNDYRSVGIPEEKKHQLNGLTKTSKALFFFSFFSIVANCFPNRIPISLSETSGQKRVIEDWGHGWRTKGNE